MKKNIMSFVASAMLLATAMPAMAAPLFPDVKDDHWAKDAVAALAAKGLLEGYPDGTFKGDRAATRWEVAMIVARLLAKMEQAHATFATKAELEDLRKLVNALREELDALGVRVTNLEENVSRIDKRVTELERITFYGYVDTRGSFGAFVNDANNNNDNNRGIGSQGFGTFGGAAAGTASPGQLNYNAAVGSALGANLDYRNGRPFPVVDYRNGAPLLNGVGFTARAVLGLRVRVSEDIDAGAEFSAFTSQGNSVIDAYWGVQAPWLSNTFTANSLTTNTAANAPYTRMTLDNFWVVHNPSHTKLILGAYSEKNIDPLVFAGQYSPNAYYGRFTDSYGFNVSGKVDVGDAGVFRWEALGTRLGDNFTAYDSFLLGADVEFEFEGGSVKANVARVSQEAIGGATRTVGLVGAVANGNVGAVNNGGQLFGNVNAGASTGYTPLQWVNPAGFFVAQQSGFNQTNGGGGTTVDQRPIPGWTPGAGDFASGAFGGGLGPQGQMSYGLGANYKFDLGGGDAQIYVSGNYAHSDYKPNANSGYQVGGNAYKFEVGANLLDGDLDLSAQYLSTDPTYDPFLLQIPAGSGFQGGMRLPDLNYFTGLYSLHDTQQYPHNRRGVRFNGQFRFNERRGLLWAKAGFLDQVDTSLYDVRLLTGAVGANAPTNTVMGFSPGFIDPVFSGFAHPFVYGAGTANSFTESLAPLENPRGHSTNYGIGVNYKFDDPRVKIELGYERNEFERNSALAPGFGGSQNQVTLNIGSLHGQVNWEASDQWTLRAGADLTTIDGHYDPAGKYNLFAIQTGSRTFNNIDSTQLSPFLGFDYDVSANTQWNMDFRYYTTTSGTNVPLNLATDTIGNSNNPFEWNGWQVSTQFKVKF